MSFKEIYVLDFSRFDKLIASGFELDDDYMPGYALRNYDNENKIFVDILGTYYGIKGLVLWNDVSRKDDIRPHIEEYIKSGLFTKKVMKECEQNV